MNEKLMILKMLENGQISAAEAANLLKSVEGGTPTPPPASPFDTAPPPSAPMGGGFTPPPAPPAIGPSTSAYTGHGNNGRPPAHGGYGSSTPPRGTSTVEDLSRKFESFARDMAPKVQKFTEVVADKIAGVADMASGVFAPPSEPAHGAHQPHSYETPRPMTAGHAPTTAVAGMKEINIEMLVESGGYNELSLSGLNGELRIKGYNGDKITARITHRAKRHGTPIELMKLGGKYFLKYDSDDFHSVSIDAYVPERAFSVIKIDGINCQLDCASLSASEMLIVNANGATRISGLSANNLTAESSNAPFTVSNITAVNATIENMNGTLDTSELDIANLKLTNYNGPLSLIMSKFERHSDYIWSIETGNAKLGMNLPTLPDLGYHIKAHAAMGEIRLGLTSLQFLINEPSLVEARSIHFERATKKVKLAVETSNAPLVIN